MSMRMLWPIALGVCSELLYQICAKSTPAEIHPLASLSVTYAVGAVTSVALYYLLSKDGNLTREYAHINWAVLLLGVVVVGLEVGAIYMYKVGWTVSTGPLVKNVCIMIALAFVGLLLYHETLTPNKVIGIVLCLIGVIFINK